MCPLAALLDSSTSEQTRPHRLEEMPFLCQATGNERVDSCRLPPPLQAGINSSLMKGDAAPYQPSDCQEATLCRSPSPLLRPRISAEGASASAEYSYGCRHRPTSPQASNLTPTQVETTAAVSIIRGCMKA